MSALGSIISDVRLLARADQGEVPADWPTCQSRTAGMPIDFFELLLDEMRLMVAIAGDDDISAPTETSLFRRGLDQPAPECDPARPRRRLNHHQDGRSADAMFDNGIEHR